MIRKPEKVGTPEHKHKFPDRYKVGYVDWWNRDKKEKINNEPLVKQFRNDDPSTYLSSPEQQKGMLLATIEDAKKHKLKPRKKINTYADIKIPTVNYSLLRNSAADKAKAAEIEKLRVHAFTSRPDEDAVRGIGSLTNSTVKKLKAAGWLRGNQTTYKR